MICCKLTEALVEQYGDGTDDSAFHKEDLLHKMRSKKLNTIQALQLLASSPTTFNQFFNPSEMKIHETSRLITTDEKNKWQSNVSRLLKLKDRKLSGISYGYGSVENKVDFNSQFSLAHGPVLSKQYLSSNSLTNFIPLMVTRKGEPRGWLITELIHDKGQNTAPDFALFTSGHNVLFDLNRAFIPMDILNGKTS